MARHTAGVPCLILLVPGPVRAQDTSVLCTERGDCQRIWISELGFAYRLGLSEEEGTFRSSYSSETATRFNFTWEFGVLEPMNDNRTGLGGTTYCGVDLAGNARGGLKARQRTLFDNAVLDIGIGLLFIDTRGGVGATRHLGIGLGRHVGFKVQATQLTAGRGWGDLAVAHIGMSATKLRERLSPVEATIRGILPLIVILIELL